MKIYSIAMFLLCLNISIALINTSGIFLVGAQENQQLNDNSKGFVEGEGLLDNSVTSEQTAVNLGFGDFIKGFGYFITNFALSVVVLPYLLNQIGLSWAIAFMVSLPIYAVYAAGIIQFISNRSFSNME